MSTVAEGDTPEGVAYLALQTRFPAFGLDDWRAVKTAARGIRVALYRAETLRRHGAPRRTIRRAAVRANLVRKIIFWPELLRIQRTYW